MAMNGTRLEKLTLNVGAGQSRERLQSAKDLLERLSGQKAVLTKAKDRNPTWKTRKGDLIGVKVTLRGKRAGEFLKKALDAVDSRIQARSFDASGNFSFGVKEYIDFPGMKYDSKIGMLGFDVCVTLSRPGARIACRRIARKKVPPKQRVGPEEAKEFVKKNFNAEIA
ncbi:MAG: 50S ribosomal protein L5 [Candidatus Micrarchaeota archaeon]|nr:50S ribosomal protein L5 [Candidatus Micrarchaeota archaeon]